MPWNRAFDGGAVMTADDGAVREIDVPEGPRLALLSPTPKRLRALHRTWRADLARLQRGEPPDADTAPESPALPDDLEALATSPTSPDASPANGSSIALLLEHSGRTCLLAADAFTSVLRR